MRLAIKFICAVIGGSALLIGGAVGLMAFLEYPGGMRSSYRAADHDRRLTGIAREAIPIITALDGFYLRHGACPQPTAAEEIAEWQSGLPASLTAQRHGRFIVITGPTVGPGWIYDISEPDPSECSLSRKLGWDPALVWLKRSDGAHWVFVPGDGSADKPIRIDLENRLR